MHKRKKALRIAFMCSDMATQRMHKWDLWLGTKKNPVNKRQIINVKAPGKISN